MTINNSDIELARFVLANFREETTIYRPGSFSYYKALSEKQAKYIKILESSNAALLESLQRLEIQLKEIQTKASQEV